ncbi:MAG: 50S ribosomal protein L18 [Candidatus Moranbacteria bacterium]|nr:50S ribosomal protein L18 [Candidatus Moranbacteria bacterium]
MKIQSRNQLRKRRQRRIRKKIIGTAQKPRLNVFFSLRHAYAQVIDDEANKVLAAAGGKALKEKSGKIKQAEEVGRAIAEECLKKKIKETVFDRGGYKYHGKVKALAEAARKAGLKF